MIKAFRIAGVLLMCWAMPVLADPATRAMEAARALESATEALQAATRQADRIAALTQTVQAYEDGLAALREGLRDAQLAEAAQTRLLSDRSAELSRLLAVLMGTASLEDGVILVHPQGALAAARAGLSLRDVAPALGRDVAALREQLEDIAALRRARQYGLLALEQGLASAQDARLALTQAIAERGPLPKRLSEDPDNLAALAASAASLDAFARDLAERSVSLAGVADSALQGFRNAKGRLPFPVRGTVLRGFGMPDQAGVARDGIDIATLPEAVVSAPWAGTVRYAGPLAGRGQVVIFEPDEDILLVMVGLGEVLVETAEILPQGAPLGTMPAQSGDQSPAGSRGETLYFEMRETGKPIDPADWFALTAG
jgi:septal ring factor EnvC (AmiA/AmiB activator)